jgi:predicted ATP-grasp superfamily ATP-dependent carboligase
LTTYGKIQIVESFASSTTGKTIIQAFTGSGLVASIVAHHLTEKLNLVEKGYISSNLIPSVGIVRDGVIQRPVRIFENETYLLIISEIGVSQDNLTEFIESLFEWYVNIDPASIVIVGALPTGRSADATDLRYNIVASDTMIQNFISEKGLWTMPQGAVYGSVALSLMEANKCGLSSFAILSHCIATIPDYLAAKKVIEILSITLDENIPLDPLDKNADDLREHLQKREKNKRKQKGSSEDLGNYELFNDYVSDYIDDEDEDEEEDDDLDAFI